MMGKAILSASRVKMGLVVAVLWACVGVGTVTNSTTRAAEKRGALQDVRVQVLALGDLSDLVPYPLFIRGDANRDTVVTVADGVVILKFLFQAGSNLSCPDAADFNDDGTIDISDPIALLQYLFLGGLPPPAPCQCAGLDPTPDQLGCE
jgi:hypothetical protein